MISHTTFKHPTVVAKIDKAMRRAVGRASRNRTGVGISVIKNKRKVAVGLIEYRRNPGHVNSGFRFWWRCGSTVECCTEYVIKALRGHA